MAKQTEYKYERFEEKNTKRNEFSDEPNAWPVYSGWAEALRFARQSLKNGHSIAQRNCKTGRQSCGPTSWLPSYLQTDGIPTEENPLRSKKTYPPISTTTPGHALPKTRRALFSEGFFFALISTLLAVLAQSLPQVVRTSSYFLQVLGPPR